MDGRHGWAATLTTVAVVDGWLLRNGRPTLSRVFREAPRRATVVAWGYLTAHLFGIIPERLDPLRRWW